MRTDAENATANLALKTVHHRKDDDQSRYAKREAEHGDDRDERDKPAPMRRTQIPGADEPLVEGTPYSLVP